MPALIPFDTYRGKKFGMLTIIEDLGLSTLTRKRKVVALCDCGIYKEYHLMNIKKNINPNCGCYDIKHKEEFVGRKFGILTVLEELMSVNRQRMMLVRCACGNKTSMSISSLNSGTQSCGCIGRLKHGDRMRTHGLSKHDLYGTWGNIKSRCINPNLESYEDYGKRGICVCDEWLNDFMSFYNWCMENGWQKGLSIDRIDNDGHYEPSNCRIGDFEIQSRNKRNNVWIEYQGERLVVTDWCKKLGLKETTVYCRILNGMDPVEALTKEVKLNNFQSKKLRHDIA